MPRFGSQSHSQPSSERFEHEREPAEPGLPRTGPELRAQRLGFALRSLAAELVDERRRSAQLRREIADLRARLEALEPKQGDDRAAGGAVAPLP